MWLLEYLENNEKYGIQKIYIYNIIRVYHCSKITIKNLYEIMTMISLKKKEIE